VEAIKLDDYTSRSRFSEVHLMKIDAEGAEVDIFSGAELTITRLRPIILCEVLDQVARPWGRAGVDSIDFLERRGYEWFEFRESGDLQPHSRREEYPGVRNYLAVPREKLASVASFIAA
jgi:hypothetical protein